jgi:hypothetical protein
MDTEEAAPEQPGGAKLAAKAKKVPGKRGQAARKQKEEQQVQGPEENTTAEEQGAGGEEGEGGTQGMGSMPACLCQQHSSTHTTGRHVHRDVQHPVSSYV